VEPGHCPLRNGVWYTEFFFLTRILPS
jgi:hypothetical protein